jgi:hypothetical protein
MQLLLDHGADPTIRASLRKKLHPGYGGRYDVDKTYEYRNITASNGGNSSMLRTSSANVALKLLEDRLRGEIM